MMQQQASNTTTVTVPRQLGDLQVAILRVLDEAGPAGLSTTVLRPLVDPDLSLLYAQNRLNASLYRLRDYGLAVRTGKRWLGSRASGYRWHITDAGREALQRPTAAETAAAAERERAARRDRIDATLARYREAGFGPDSPLDVKRSISRLLKDDGFTLQQIAGLFGGVTRERVRQWIDEAKAAETR